MPLLPDIQAFSKPSLVDPDENLALLAEFNIAEGPLLTKDLVCLRIDVNVCPDNLAVSHVQLLAHYQRHLFV